MHRTRLFATAAITLATLAVVPQAKANLLINPAGGTNFTAAFTDPDDGSVSRNIGGSFNFYGTNLTSVFVQADGFLASADDNGFFADRGIQTLANDTTSKVIAGLYDDLIIGTTGTVLSDQVTAAYYAVTYSNIYGLADTTAGRTSTFQIALFKGNTTIGGFNFLLGDIAISYGALNSALSGTATVGIASSATTFTPLPGTADGQISSLTGLPTGSSFLLFRPSIGNVPYVASVASLPGTTAVPEPSDVALLAIGALGLFAGSRRRKAPARC